MNPRTQIIATIGPASESVAICKQMVEAGVDILRMNFAWQTHESTARYMALVKEVEDTLQKKLLIVADLPGPRVQGIDGHSFNSALPPITKKDEEVLAWCATEHIPYVALSFVAQADDVLACKKIITSFGGSQRVIAKIERAEAVANIDSIIEVADGIMVARGDLGENIPLEEVPFVQQEIVRKANTAGKPVIVATQMLLSMTAHEEPTRAEVTDVTEAVRSGADAVMLSDETASGQFPVAAVAMMDRIIRETEMQTGRTMYHNLI